jgi:hypothetical protein
VVSKLPAGVISLRACSDAQGRELAVRDLDPDPLLLFAQHVDLADVARLQQLAADVLHMVAQLPEGVAVGGESVDVAERVTELVVEEGPARACRQRRPDVAEFLAHLIPGVRHLARRRLVLEHDEYE